MRCTSPRTVGFQSDGKTIAWSYKQASKQYASFQLPCGQCLECRLAYARDWAVRCVHEAEMHPENSFITLTYSDEHIGDNKLDYRDFQLFMKKLRKICNQKISYFVTGEYGEKSKRKHWHAIIFNWRPKDLVPLEQTHRGDQLYRSETLEKLWTFGNSSVGDVTFESAGYCARYAAKKLVHGNDDDHDFKPISKKSSHTAIGKTWLEKFFKDIFNFGNLILPDGRPAGSIPRYYEKWLKKHQPEFWSHYVTQTKLEKSLKAAEREKRDQLTRPYSTSKSDAIRIIGEQRYKKMLNKPKF